MLNPFKWVLYVHSLRISLSFILYDHIDFSLFFFSQKKKITLRKLPIVETWNLLSGYCSIWLILKNVSARFEQWMQLEFFSLSYFMITLISASSSSLSLPLSLSLSLSFHFFSLHEEKTHFKKVIVETFLVGVVQFWFIRFLEKKIH